jgi:hypothetical protein
MAQFFARDDAFTYETISMTMTRTELIEEISEQTKTSKSKLITKSTDVLAHMLADHYASLNVEVNEPEAKKMPKAKKTTRTCKICGCEKPLDEYGPTHKQVACKGECLKEYTRQAIARAKARANVAQAEAEALVRVNALALELAPDSFVGPRVLWSADERVLFVA